MKYPPLNSDAFTKRENADENYHIRQREIEKLQQLKEKIAGHQKQLADLDNNVYGFPPPWVFFFVF